MAVTLKDHEFDALVADLFNIYKIKTGRNISPVSSITHGLLELLLALNRRVLELESVIYGR